MLNRMKFFIFNVLLSCALGSHGVNYDGDQIWRLTSEPSDSLPSVFELLNQHEFDIWAVKKNTLDFRVPASQVQKLTALWKGSEIPFQVVVEDVGRLIESEKKTRRTLPESLASNFTFEEYHTLDEIFAYLDNLEETSDLVTSEEIGRTQEGRELRVMKVSTPDAEPGKPAIWLDCGIHAREWISPATCLFGLDYITTTYGSDVHVTSLLDKYDLYILPVLNADGYDYTWTTDRLWRKNRMQYDPEGCVGVDLNRNYDDGHWGEVGSSNRSCNDIYHGPTPFSEKETSAVRDKILSIQQTSDVIGFFSIHSYGQLWLFAFGYTNVLPAEVDDLYRVSQIGVDGIASVYGSVYTNGPHFSTIYPASGVSVDWGYSVGIVHSYIVELRDEGTYGFLLPEDQIIPTATEAWTGFISAINAI